MRLSGSFADAMIFTAFDNTGIPVLQNMFDQSYTLVSLELDTERYVSRCVCSIVRT